MIWKLGVQAALVSIFFMAGASVQAEVVRHAGPPRPPILSGATITPGSTLMLVSGQIPSPLATPATSGTLPSYGDTKAQSINVFEKIRAILEKNGFAMGDVVKLTVFLVGDPKLDGKMDLKGFGEAYSQFFGTPQQPNLSARSVVQVAALAAPEFLVEIEAIAAR